jgi:hypothetical protein
MHWPDALIVVWLFIAWCWNLPEVAGKVACQALRACRFMAGAVAWVEHVCAESDSEQPAVEGAGRVLRWLDV